MNIFAKLHAGITTASGAETQAIACELALALPADTTLALHGDMGVGKTTFVQGLARGFGIKEAVTSPTFAIYTVYRGTERTLLHLDAYRLENERQIDPLLLEDFLVSPWCLAVEWPEKVGAWLPSPALHLTLSIENENKHTIRLDR